MAIVKLLDRKQLQRIALDEVFQHELGCTCDFCGVMQTRYVAAPLDSPDDFARAGGEHQAYPFDAEQTQHLASIANSLKIVASAVNSIRDIFRGRDAEDKKVKSPYAAIAEFLCRGVAPQAGPATQRTPAPAPAPAAAPAQAAPMQAPTAATQALLFGAPAKQKRIATDAEMQQMINNLGKFTPKIRFDKPQQWPGESQKGRKILVVNGAGNLGTEVDPTYLEIYADSLDYFAGKAKEKVAAGTADDSAKRDAQYGEIEAARCRRIALLVREGKIQQVAVAPVQTYSGGGDYE